MKLLVIILCNTNIDSIMEILRESIKQAVELSFYVPFSKVVKANQSQNYLLCP